MTARRDQDNAESERDDNVPLREWITIRKSLRQRDGRRQRDGAAHSGPADYKNLARGGQALVLMKNAPTYEIRQKCAGKDPDQTQQNNEGAEGCAVDEQRA